MLGAWAAAIALACAMRAYRRHRLLTHEFTSHERHLNRLVTTSLAVAWGVGAGLFSRWLRFSELALVMMILTGLVAGAVATFAPDRRAFRWFLAGIVVPLAAGILTAGPVTNMHVMALLLIGLFSLVMVITQQRGYTSLVQQALTNVELSVSEERAARERARLDALFASAPVATVVVDPDGLVRDANPRFQVLFGYTREEVLGRPLNDLIVPEPELHQAQRLDETVRGGMTMVTEVQRRRKDGELVSVRASAARVEGVGEPGMFVLYEDITDEIAARTALQEAKESAERVAQMRSAFLANMSHEIRTPMNAVLGLAELLLDTELTADQRRSLGLIQSSGETLLTLLNDILDLSKIEAESLQLETVPFDLPRLVDGTVSLMGVKARENKIELLADMPSSVPEQVRGDPTRLRQVLTNLVGNAVKFTHEGEVVLSVRLVSERQGPRHAALHRARHRHRDPRAAAAVHLPGVQPGRSLHDAEVRRHGARPDDRAAAGAADGRHAGGEERGGPRERVLLRGGPGGGRGGAGGAARGGRGAALGAHDAGGGRQRVQPARGARAAVRRGRHGRGGGERGARGWPHCSAPPPRARRSRSPSSTPRCRTATASSSPRTSTRTHRSRPRGS